MNQYNTQEEQNYRANSYQYTDVRIVDNSLHPDAKMGIAIENDLQASKNSEEEQKE